MTTNNTTDADDLPDYWSDGARSTFDLVTEEREDLSATDLAALFDACELLSAADRHGEVARAAGYVSIGSTGQTVVHPSAIEERLCRTSASQILARVAPLPSADAPMTASQRGRRAALARHHGRR